MRLTKNDFDILPWLSFSDIVIPAFGACRREFLLYLAADVFIPCDFFGRQLPVAKLTLDLAR
jgi:hypothetical protein